MNPFSGDVWLHLGGRLPSRVQEAADLAQGVAFPTYPNARVASDIARSTPWLVVGSREDDNSHQLFNSSAEDRWASWHAQQTGAEVLVGPVQTLPGDPKDTKGIDQAIDALNEYTARTVLSGDPRPKASALSFKTSWLKTAHRHVLLSVLKSIDGPVGLMALHSADPYANRGNLSGLLEILRERPGVSVLRGDQVVLGALANGSSGGTIGRLPSQRHTVPPGSIARGKVLDLSPRVFVAGVMDWVSGRALDSCPATMPFMSCACPVCDGRALTRFLGPESACEAELHNVHTWGRLVDEIRHSRSPLTKWTVLCQEANYNLDEIDDSIGFPWRTSAQLHSWLELAGVPV